MTPRQMDALRFITGYQEAKGYCASVREIALGIGGNAIGKTHEALDGLEERGHIRRLPNRARAIEVLTAVPVPRGPDGEPLYFVGSKG